MESKEKIAMTNDALKILQKMTAIDPEIEEMVQESSLNAELAQLIYNARQQAGLTQQQLADRIGTKQSVIARLEDAEYEGHSLSMLQKIALALNHRLEVKLVGNSDRLQ
jgi:ribosome-binding protein aMBF1 (putative translation factor)